MKQKLKVIVLVGPTASGKTALGIELAKDFTGEIISADSRQIYQGLDIGTGKVTKEEMAQISHHLLDVVPPEETYTVTDFVRDGRKAIEDIASRGKLPIIVGGTFFYIDALLGRVVAPEVPPNESLREVLETKTQSELYALLKEKDPLRAETIDRDNPRRLIRALEITEALGRVPSLEQEELYDVLTIGIKVSKETLKGKIHTRLHTRMEAGMLAEIEHFYRVLPRTRLDELGIEYRYGGEYFDGKITKEELLSLIETKTWHYAKRQMTWLKRDTTIKWVDVGDTSTARKLAQDFI